MGIFTKIKMDLKHVALREKANLSLTFYLRMFLITGGFQYVLCRRIQEGLILIPIIGRPARRIFWWMTNMIFGSEIAIGAKVGGGLYIPHPYGIVVGVCEIGENVTLLQNVTIGVKSGSDAGLAVIGDDAFLSTGCVVLGDVKVGKGATIGANSVVLTDVPDGAIAIGAPARIKINMPGLSAL